MGRAEADRTAGPSVQAAALGASALGWGNGAEPRQKRNNRTAAAAVPAVAAVEEEEMPTAEGAGWGLRSAVLPLG